MKLSTPPKDVAPERLFRALAGQPAPRWPIMGEWCRVAGLFAYALRGCDLADMSRGASTEMQRAASVSAILAGQVRDETGARVWGSAAELDAVYTSDMVEHMWRDVGRALAVVSPVYGRCDRDEWKRALEAGARHVSNEGLMRGIAASRLMLPMMTKKPLYEQRPDLFFGLPTQALTDGQWMAYEAACAVLARM